MKNTYIVLERESRGELGSTEVHESDLNIVDFCNKLHDDFSDRELDKVKDSKDDYEDVKNYLDEMKGITKLDNFYEVGLYEELYYEVYEVKHQE